MIPALEHDFEFASGPAQLREVLKARGGQSGWQIVGFTEGRDGVFTLLFTRQAPASPNTGETKP